MPMQLLKLLVILLRMFLLRCRFVCIIVIVCVTALTYKASLLRDVNRIALVDVCKCMLWNTNLLALMLLAAG